MWQTIPAKKKDRKWTIYCFWFYFMLCSSESHYYYYYYYYYWFYNYPTFFVRVREDAPRLEEPLALTTLLHNHVSHHHGTHQSSSHDREHRGHKRKASYSPVPCSSKLLCTERRIVQPAESDEEAKFISSLVDPDIALKTSLRPRVLKKKKPVLQRKTNREVHLSRKDLL